MKKITQVTFLLALAFLFLSGCTNESDGKGTETLKVGLNASGIPIWEPIKEKAAEKGIKLELVEFSDYVRPNTALAQGDIDLNAFQTISYFDSFIEDRGLDLEPIASTYIAPMGIYSEKFATPEEIPEGSKIALPQEATNMGRALLLLQSANLIELPKDFDGSGTVENIKGNPKNLEFVPTVAAQTPRALPDVAASVINNGVAVEADLLPADDAIFLENDEATPYINIIATRAEDVDNPTMQKIVDIYQQEEVANQIRDIYDDSLIPTFVSLEEIGW